MDVAYPDYRRHLYLSALVNECVKGRLNGKVFNVAANPIPFDTTEAYYVEASLYDELAPSKDNQNLKTSGMPLSQWEEIRDDPESDLRHVIENKR
ncbi:hypothetical protein REPUB_Repub04eG0171100 [Reevesia pubescens]